MDAGVQKPHLTNFLQPGPLPPRRRKQTVTSLYFQDHIIFSGSYPSLPNTAFLVFFLQICYAINLGKEIIEVQKVRFILVLAEQLKSYLYTYLSLKNDAQ